MNHLRPGYCYYKGEAMPNIDADAMRQLERNMRRTEYIHTYRHNESRLIEGYQERYPQVVKAIVSQFYEDVIPLMSFF